MPKQQASEFVTKPWKIGPPAMKGGFPVELAAHAYPIIVADGSGAVIAWIDSMGFRFKHQHHARLIKSAPSLLEAMDALIEYAEKFGELSEAPKDSAVWEAVDRARALRRTIAHPKPA